MAEKYNGIERKLFADVYNFFLRYKDMPNEESTFDVIAKESSELAKTFCNHPFAIAMITATVTQLEHKIVGSETKGHSYVKWEEIIKHWEKTVYKISKQKFGYFFIDKKIFLW